MPNRSQQKNCELKRAAQPFLKLIDLLKNLRSDDQSSYNQSLDDVTSKNCKKSQVSRNEITFYLNFISVLALMTFSFMKYIDPFLLHLITMKNKIRGVLSYFCNTRTITYNVIIS